MLRRRGERLTQFGKLMRLVGVENARVTEDTKETNQIIIRVHVSQRTNERARYSKLGHL